MNIETNEIDKRKIKHIADNTKNRADKRKNRKWNIFSEVIVISMILVSTMAYNASATSTELLSNPGFERIGATSSIPDNWLKYQSGIINTNPYIYPTSGVSGYGISIKYPDLNTGAAAWIQNVKISPGKQFTLSAYIKTNLVNGYAKIGIDWFDGDTFISHKSYIAVTGNTDYWTKYSKTITSPSNANNGNIFVKLADAKGQVWFDDISFKTSNPILPTPTPIPTPSPTPAPAPNTDTIRVYRGDSGRVEVLNIETQYLPYVVMPEDGSFGVPFESLKAQAILSRTYAYYKKKYDPSGSNFDVYDDDRDQVYDPSSNPTNNVRNSILQTNGIILKWSYRPGYNYPSGCSPPININKVITVGFYYQGDSSSGTNEKVTYNKGKSGECIEQTSGGTVRDPPSLNPYNRGALGQDQSHILANNGYGWQNILKYFFGEDIIIEQR